MSGSLSPGCIKEFDDNLARMRSQFTEQAQTNNDLKNKNEELASRVKYLEESLKIYKPFYEYYVLKVGVFTSYNQSKLKL